MTDTTAQPANTAGMKVPTEMYSAQAQKPNTLQWTSPENLMLVQLLTEIKKVLERIEQKIR
jgi:hypothetical protein